MLLAKSYFKDSKEEQYYLLRNYAPQNTETRLNPLTRKLPFKCIVAADSRAICPKICKNRAAIENVPTQKSSKISPLYTTYLPANNPASQRTQSTNLQGKSVNWFS